MSQNTTYTQHRAMARDKYQTLLLILSTLAILGTLSLPLATCSELPPDVIIQACKGNFPNGYFKSITAKAGSGQGGTLRGKPVRYTLTLVPSHVQPTPALPSSLDLRVVLSIFLDVKKATMKRPSGSSAISPVIDRNTTTVTWNNIGDALLGVGSKKGVPQRLTFTITATLASNTPDEGTKIKAYLIDEGNVCEVQVAEAKVKVREPTSAKAIRGGKQ